MFWLSVLKVFVIHFGDGFAHGLPLKFETVGVVNDAIQDGICEGWFTDNIMPGFDGPLRANKSETIEWLKFTLEGVGERTHGYAFEDTAF